MPPTTLTEVSSAEPSAAGWRALCNLLAPLAGEALDEALSHCRAPVSRWPTSLRRVHPAFRDDPAVAWTSGLFEGRVDPRLALVGRAELEHHQPSGDGVRFLGDHAALYPIAKSFSRYVDPSFDPVDAVLDVQHEYTPANGCGGGFDSETRGDGVRGLRWYDTVTEHAADDSSDGAWSPYGLASEISIRVGRYERSTWRYTFAVSGEAPTVLVLAHAWGTLLRGRQPATHASIDAALAEAARACAHL